MSGPIRTVVLAGGDGRRLLGVTGGVPKQFWCPAGARSLVEETLDRVGPLTSADRTVVVANARQAGYLADTRVPQLGRLVLQPENRGTAAAVLFGLAPTIEETPDGLVLVTPSDHGVADPVRFRNSVLDAAASVTQGRADIVLFGAAPDAPATDYGWVVLGPHTGGRRAYRLREVAGFVEKPPPSEAERLYRSGAVWSTLVLVARVGALVALFERHLPRLVRAFAAYVGAPAAARADRMRELYARLDPADFSRDVLACATGLAALTWPTSVGWTDLGTPERLARWLITAGAAASTR